MGIIGAMGVVRGSGLGVGLRALGRAVLLGVVSQGGCRCRLKPAFRFGRPFGKGVLIPLRGPFTLVFCADSRHGS
jgi:hypothetical protein